MKTEWKGWIYFKNCQNSWSVVLVFIVHFFMNKTWVLANTTFDTIAPGDTEPRVMQYG